MCFAVAGNQTQLGATGASPHRIVTYRHDVASAGAKFARQSAKFRSDAAIDDVFFVDGIARHVGASLES